MISGLVRIKPSVTRSFLHETSFDNLWSHRAEILIHPHRYPGGIHGYCWLLPWRSLLVEIKGQIGHWITPQGRGMSLGPNCKGGSPEQNLPTKPWNLVTLKFEMVPRVCKLEFTKHLFEITTSMTYWDCFITSSSRCWLCWVANALAFFAWSSLFKRRLGRGWTWTSAQESALRHRSLHRLLRDVSKNCDCC